MLLLPDNFVPTFHIENNAKIPALWFVFSGNRILVHQEDDAYQIPYLPVWPTDVEITRRIAMGKFGEIPCYAAELEEQQQLPSIHTLVGLRELWGNAIDAHVGLAAQAIQLIDWDRSHQFCGRCGAAMTFSSNDRSKRCPSCELSHYPRLAPAVMVRIIKDGAILLARSPRFPPELHSVLAGFVDPGESLEQTAHREVMEEVGLKIKNLQYITSQPWPFPHSLMIGFSADYAGGEIVEDQDEIEHAAWYTPDNLPRIPAEISIARFLIDDYLKQYAS